MPRLISMATSLATHHETPGWSVNSTNNTYGDDNPIVYQNAVVNYKGMYSTSTGEVTIPFTGTWFIALFQYLRIDNNEDAYPRLQYSIDGGSNWANLCYAYTHITGASGSQVHNTVSYQVMNEFDKSTLLRVANQGSGDIYRGAQENRFSGFLMYG